MAGIATISATIACHSIFFTSFLIAYLLPFILPSLSAYHPKDKISFRRDTYLQLPKIPKLPDLPLMLYAYFHYFGPGENTYPKHLPALEIRPAFDYNAP